MTAWMRSRRPSFPRRGGPGPWGRRYAGPDPRAILAERYARGEIGLDEYRERRANLDS